MKETIRKSFSYKAIVSILFGFLGFAVNLWFTAEFAFPPFTAVILIGLLFPMLITLTWGWKYGLLSALAGGCQSMWWLWGPSNGYAIFLVVPPFTLWIIWHGFWNGWRKKQNSYPWWLSAYAVEIPFRVISTINLYTLSRWAITLNPPPWSWAAGAPSTIPMPFSNFVVIKQAVVGYVILLLADVLLNLGFVRKFFGLKEEYNQANTSYIISASLLIGGFVWLIDGIVSYLVFQPGSSLLDLLVLNIPPQDIFMRTTFVLTCLMGGLLASYLLRGQHESNQALLESEEHYRGFFESVPISLVETDLSEVKKFIDELRGQGVTDLRDYFDHHPQAVQDCAALVRFVDINQTSMEMSEITNKADFLEKYDFGEETQSLTIFKEELIAFAEGASVHEIEMPYLTPSGKTKYDIKRVSIPPAFAENWSRVLVSFTDITDRVQAEVELKGYSDRLEEMVADRTSQLQSVNEELEAFSYSVSHDLKAPLRGINQLASWISSDYVEVLDQDGQEKLGLLVSRTKHMHKLIEDILKYSRIGHTAAEKQKVDLNQLVRETIEILAVPENILISIENELPTVVGVYAHFEQIFQNLLSNAIKFIDKPEGFVKIGCADKENYWQFNVADNGPGIDEKYFDRIFQMFQTLAPSSEEDGSTGIGLTLVKKIVEMHGGRVWLGSTVGEGSTFFFTLPKEGVSNERE